MVSNRQIFLSGESERAGCLPQAPDQSNDDPRHAPLRSEAKGQHHTQGGESVCVCVEEEEEEAEEG